uniref:Uncharacterized protein n=1 Tax=Anopheles coluzzii TaxID=1518534 RepID=A0A8W7PC31_ANOCL
MKEFAETIFQTTGQPTGVRKSCVMSLGRKDASRRPRATGRLHPTFASATGRLQGGHGAIERQAPAVAQAVHQYVPTVVVVIVARGSHYRSVLESERHLTSHAQLVHRDGLGGMAHAHATDRRRRQVRLDAALLRERTAVAADQLERVCGQHSTAVARHRLQVLRWWRCPLRQVGKLGRRHLVVLQRRMMVPEYGGGVRLRVDRQAFQLAADVVGHLAVFVALFRLQRAVPAGTAHARAAAARLIQPRLVPLYTPAKISTFSMSRLHPIAIVTLSAVLYAAKPSSCEEDIPPAPPAPPPAAPPSSSPPSDDSAVTGWTGRVPG